MIGKDSSLSIARHVRVKFTSRKETLLLHQLQKGKLQYLFGLLPDHQFLDTVRMLETFFLLQALRVEVFFGTNISS